MRFKNLFASLVLSVSLFSVFAVAETDGSLIKTSQTIMLGDTPVKINTYEKPGSKITFFAPHHNEQSALKIAKEYVERNGGRVIEIQSFDERGFPSRYVKFNFDGKTYNVDPNRIFTENGRFCGYPAPDLNSVVKLFADNILQTLFKTDGKTLRDGETMIIAVHNNSDVDAKLPTSKATDLTAISFFRGDNTERFSHGVFSDQADGVFMSNLEADADNFVFLSTFVHMRYFAERGFNIVVQKAPAKLQQKLCTVDDGSLSVYSGQQNIPYICLEADGSDGGYRQRQMMEAVYQLVKSNAPLPVSAATPVPVATPTPKITPMPAATPATTTTPTPKP